MPKLASRPQIVDFSARAPNFGTAQAAGLAIAVTDQETRALVGEVEAEVARLLGDPGARWVSRAAGQPDAPARVRDKEQHVLPAQEHTLDREEVARDDARCLDAQEFAPART